jgi:hypothetical protein
MEAAFFDLDKTIIARSTGLALTHTFMRAGFIAPRTVLRSAFASFVSNSWVRMTLAANGCEFGRAS